jgi:tRNA pseudouridine38-40 synthase
MRFRLLIEYKGSSYYGWQIQSGQVTIQGEIENALKKIYSKNIGIIGAGRTDTGVHARGQFAHFDVDSEIDTDILQRSLNGILNSDICIKEISRADPEFHARYSALSREYRYFIAPHPTAIFREYVWFLTYDLNLKEMSRAAGLIVGRHDFKSFCRAKADVKNHFCHVEEAKWYQKDGFIIFMIKADRFLHGMVRSLVGTMVDVGRYKIDVKEFQNILNGKNRSLAGQAAPAKGLILEKVYY